MAIKKVWDTPLWLPTAQYRTATSALASMTFAKDTLGRYIYYCSGTLFYKYDIWKDTHIKLASPPAPGVTATAMRYSDDEGYHGNCLSSSGATTMTIAGLNGNILAGKKIKIISGKGIEQERTILSATELKIEKSGIVTTASNILLQDTTKRWEINQWIGYQVRVVYGTGTSQIRKILYNDANTLYFWDINYQQLESWNNTLFSATAPYAAPVATAGLQANYYIESSVITVDSAWTIQPDQTSSYVIKGGGVFLISAAAVAPWSTFQFYDVLSDTWTTKTALGGNLTAALGTDYSIDILTRETPYLTGTSTSVTARVLTDTSKTMVIDRYCNYELRITNGTGIGQRNRIVANGTNYFEIEKPFAILPGATSTYEINSNTDRIFLVGNSSSSIYQYSIDNDNWFTNPLIDAGLSRNMAVLYAGQEAIGVSTAVRNTGGITSLSATPTAGGTGYAVGDLFNITTGGTVGKGRVEAVSVGGVVTSVSLYSAGLTYTTGTGKATTIISGTGNNGLTVNILVVGIVGRITTAMNVNLYKNDLVTFSGDALWAGDYNILAIDSLTTFDIIITAAGNATALATQSVTVLVDSAKNWVINEHVGKIIKIDTVGPSPTSQFRRITSNTATTITVPTIVAAINGTSRYLILSAAAFGRDRALDNVTESGDGHATGGSPTTLIDTNKNWPNSIWIGYKVRILAGTGVGSEVVISGNTNNTLTLTTPGFTADATTKYAIMTTFGIGTGTFAATTMADSTKNWVVNKWAGKRLIITSGTGQRQETTIASNTNNTLTFGSITAPDATSTYTILGVSTRSSGCVLRWIYGGSVDLDKGRYMICVRGGLTNTIDRYDIIDDYWDISTVFSPQSEVLGGGSSYVYDGANLFYCTVSTAADFIYIFSIDVNSMEVNGALQTTALQGTTHIGNFMEIVTSDDGGKFLYLGINTSRLMYKTLLY